MSGSKYILEEDTDNTEINKWKIIDVHTSLEVAYINRLGDVFFVHSDHLQNRAESSDPLVALRSVLNTDNIWIRRGRHVLRLEPEDLQRK